MMYHPSESSQPCDLSLVTMLDHCYFQSIVDCHVLLLSLYMFSFIVLSSFFNKNHTHTHTQSHRSSTTTETRGWRLDAFSAVRIQNKPGYYGIEYNPTRENYIR